jgi:hypothetical protein
METIQEMNEVSYILISWSGVTDFFLNLFSI